MRNGFLFAATVAVALLLPAGAQAFCESEGADPSELTLVEARTAAFCLINEARDRAGVKPVRTDERLERAAQRHSSAMDAGNFFGHNSPSGTSPLSRIRSTGYLSGAAAWGIGENLRWGSGRLGSPRASITSWLHSPPHRSTMLSGRYREVGIGVAFGSPMGGGGDAAIYTADFGYRK